MQDGSVTIINIFEQFKKQASKRQNFDFDFCVTYDYLLNPLQAFALRACQCEGWGRKSAFFKKICLDVINVCPLMGESKQLAI